MKKQFFQELMNSMMFKKLTTAFPFLRKEKLDQEDVKQTIHSLQKDGLISSIKSSDQDPRELGDMAITAFDESVKVMRERFVAGITQLVEHVNQKTV